MLTQLNGGHRPSYRSTERLPAAEQTGRTPPHAGARRGWPLVRFVVLGEDHWLNSTAVTSSDLNVWDEDEVEQYQNWRVYHYKSTNTDTLL
jgi:hypothetical protein